MGDGSTNRSTYKHTDGLEVHLKETVGVKISWKFETDLCDSMHKHKSAPRNNLRQFS